jgi:Amt family ammonium transporter
MTGSLLLAVFALPALGGAGLADGGGMGAQALGVAVTAVWSAVATFVLAKLAALVIPMRVDAEAEHDGLDVTSHGERAYEFD